MIGSTLADPFDCLRRYWCQMVAGNIRITPYRALRIRVPDFAKLPPNSCRPLAPGLSNLASRPSLNASFITRPQPSNTVELQPHSHIREGD